MIQPEIIDAFRGTTLSKARLKSRMELCVESNHEGTLKVYEGAEASKIMETFSVPSIGEKKSRDLKGTPACLGKVRGTAHVILLDSEFNNFKEGEILVSLQTMVHYLPIMKKAKAILTEFGGLTSHAAIVSRELETPCVVGIKGLISSIKTGDMVEVDAERGVVRKLS